MIYVDNAATTRISDSVFEKMLPFLREQYGNASSGYSLGVKARRAVEEARKQVAVAFAAMPSEIFFTSGGSEANSWILQSIAKYFPNQSIHVITSSIEHHSVLNACRFLELSGNEVTYLPVNNRGVVSADDVKSALRPNTKIVSIMFANNEIGTIQPISQIGRIVQEQGILFHTDAVQAVGHIPIDINELHVDFLTASAHKFNGAKGTGILFKRTGVDLAPLIFGGQQELGLRAGTENVAGIVAAGCALEESIATMITTAEHLKNLVALTVAGIKAKISDVRVNGTNNQSLPGILNIGFENISGEVLMNLLSLKGICVSTSSACTSGKDNPSHVLMALGLTDEQAKSAIRISYGRYNTTDEVAIIVSVICDVYNKIKNAILLD